MTCVIGGSANAENVHLQWGGAFLQPIEFLEADGSPWTPPGGTVVDLIFGNDPSAPVATWVATIVGNVATFSKTVAQVSAARTTITNGMGARIRMAVGGGEPTVQTVGMVVWQ